MGRGRLAIPILVCFQRCCNALKEDGDQRIRLQSHQVHLILTHIQLKKRPNTNGDEGMKNSNDEQCSHVGTANTTSDCIRRWPELLQVWTVAVACDPCEPLVTGYAPPCCGWRSSHSSAASHTASAKRTLHDTQQDQWQPHCNQSTWTSTAAFTATDATSRTDRAPLGVRRRASMHERQSRAPYAVWMGLYTADRVDAGSAVSVIGRVTS